MPLYACPECHVVHAFEPTKEERAEANPWYSDALDPNRREEPARPVRKCSICRKPRTFRPVA